MAQIGITPLSQEQHKSVSYFFTTPKFNKRDQYGHASDQVYLDLKGQPLSDDVIRTILHTIEKELDWEHTPPEARAWWEKLRKKNLFSRH